MDFEKPIRSDKESRDIEYRNANMPTGTGYSDEAIAQSQAMGAAMDKHLDELLAGFYQILDQILDATDTETWFQVIQDIEQSQEISDIDKSLIVDAMNKVWNNVNPAIVHDPVSVTDKEPEDFPGEHPEDLSQHG